MYERVSFSYAHTATVLMQENTKSELISYFNYNDRLSQETSSHLSDHLLSRQLHFISTCMEQSPARSEHWMMSTFELSQPYGLINREHAFLDDERFDVEIFTKFRLLLPNALLVAEKLGQTGIEWCCTNYVSSHLKSDAKTLVEQSLEL